MAGPHASPDLMQMEMEMKMQMVMRRVKKQIRLHMTSAIR
jgi:hypothetical protein